MPPLRQDWGSAVSDPVRPDHYHRESGHEVIDVIAAWGLDFDRGNVVKYVARAGRKGDELTDLRKAKQYLEHAIARLELAAADRHGEHLREHRAAISGGKAR